MKKKLYIAIAAVLLVLLAIGIKSALGSYTARIELEATSRAEKRYRGELDAQQAANDKQAAEQKAALEKERPKTPEQAIKVITKYIPLSTPILPVAATAQLPDAPSEFALSGEQARDIADFTLRCKQCEVDRSNYIADTSLLEKKIKSLERERDAAVNAARTGTKWQRFKRTAKTLGIGVGTGIAVCAAFCPK